jgi:flagellar biosynthesis chaperone FliJ
MAFRLQTLLDLKIKAEEDAEQAMAAAATARAKAEKRQTELEAIVVRAREKLKELLNAPLEDLGGSDDMMARERFRKRLQADIELRKQEAQAHRSGPLAAAIAAEAAARAEHLRIRQEREALEKFKEKELAKEKVIAERRAEDALGDLAIANLARKQQR